METLIYLLKVNVAVALCCFIYRAFYRKDTFFSIRRFLLQGMLILSVLYPLIDVSHWMMSNAAMTDMAVSYRNMLPEIVIYPSGSIASEAVSFATPSYSFPVYFLWFYFAVTCILLLRVFFRLMQIVWLRFHSESLVIEGVRVWRLNTDTTPFSFFSWVFINPDLHDDNELHEVLSHEMVHVRQHHSADILMAELFCVFCWLNPMSWRIKKEIRKNLEFIVDACVINEDGIDIKSYQYHLLKLAYHPSGMTLANQFNISPLKERIMMINVRKSPKIKLAAYSLIIPIVFLFLLFNNVGVLAGKLGNNESVKHVVERVSHIVSDLSPEIAGNGADPVMNTGNNPGTVAEKDTNHKKKISGVILNGDTKEPMPGVNVIVYNTDTGTITDLNGRFILMINEGDTLKFSYVGYSGFTVVARNLPSDLGALEMSRMSIDLEEVFVVSYGPERSSNHLLAETAQSETIDSSDENPEDFVFVVVEKAPEFPGGEANLLKYIADNINYPESAAKNGIQGRVSCVFVVNADGTIGDVRVVRSVEPSLDREAVRVIRSMPEWIPGEQRGKKVAVQYSIPVRFRLYNPEIKREPETIKSLSGMIKQLGLKGNELSRRQ